MLAAVWPEVGMCTYMFLEHARFLAADAALFADVLALAATSDIDIVFVRLETTGYDLKIQEPEIFAVSSMRRETK